MLPVARRVRRGDFQERGPWKCIKGSIRYMELNTSNRIKSKLIFYFPTVAHKLRCAKCFVCSLNLGVSAPSRKSKDFTDNFTHTLAVESRGSIISLRLVSSMGIVFVSQNEPCQAFFCIFIHKHTYANRMIAFNDT